LAGESVAPVSLSAGAGRRGPVPEVHRRCRQRSASRIEAAPRRRRFPANWRLNLQCPLRGTVIFIRRTNERGQVSVLGRDYATKPTWVRRLVRVEVDLTAGRLRIHGLRRRDPEHQPLLKTHRHKTPETRFHE